MRALFCYARIGNQPSRVLSPKEFDIRFRHAAHFLKKSLLTGLFCVVKCRRITRGKSGYPIQNSRFLDSAIVTYLPACSHPLCVLWLEPTGLCPQRVYDHFTFLISNQSRPAQPRTFFVDNLLFSSPESNQICHPQALFGTSFCFRIRNRLKRP